MVEGGNVPFKKERFSIILKNRIFKTMKAYKLLRLKKDGNITSLFINKKQNLPVGEWMKAYNYPTKGFQIRQGWHCTRKRNAPHLSQKGRVWAEVEIADFVTLYRPKCQGGVWYLAASMKINKIFGVK